MDGLRDILLENWMPMYHTATAGAIKRVTPLGIQTGSHNALVKMVELYEGVLMAET